MNKMREIALLIPKIVGNKKKNNDRKLDTYFVPEKHELEMIYNYI